MSRLIHTAKLGCAGLAISFCLLMIGTLALVLKVSFLAVFGWIIYLLRLVEGPIPRPDDDRVFMAVICLAGSVLLGHGLAKRFWRDAGGRSWPWALTFRWGSLILLMFIAGIAATGVTHQLGWLAREPFLTFSSFGISPKDDDLDSPLRQSDADYRLALLGDHDGRALVLFKVVGTPWGEKDRFERRTSHELVEAIRIELGLPDTEEARLECLDRAVFQPDRTFHFTHPAALNLVAPR
jgi:nitrate reductase NapE component